MARESNSQQNATDQLVPNTLEQQKFISHEVYGFAIQDWGLVGYASALQRQVDLVGLVHQELARETLVFCSHPPVVTLGRGTLDGDVCGWNGETITVNRGGRATYHGPNQIVVYPIVDLNPRGRDVHQHMRLLEDAVVRTLADFGVTASGNTAEVSGAPNERAVDGVANKGVTSSASALGAPSATGVWCGVRKIASVGIGVRNWVSFHGLALNVDHDPRAFQGLKPCGFSSETMISLEEILGHRPDREAVKTSLARHLAELLKI